MKKRRFKTNNNWHRSLIKIFIIPKSCLLIEIVILIAVVYGWPNSSRKVIKIEDFCCVPSNAFFREALFPSPLILPPYPFKPQSSALWPYLTRFTGAHCRPSPSYILGNLLIAGKQYPGHLVLMCLLVE